MSAPEPPIFVVVTSDDLNTKYRAEQPSGRKPNQIVMETNAIGSTLQREQAQAAYLARQGYGACRVGRVVFEDAPAPAAPQPGDMAALARVAEHNWTLAMNAAQDLLRQINERGLGDQFDLTKVVEALAGRKPIPTTGAPTP